MASDDDTTNKEGVIEAVIFFVIFCALALTMWTSMVWLVKLVKRHVDTVQWTQRDGPFSRKHGYSYDCVLVIKIREANEPATAFQREYSLQKIIQRLVDASIDTQMFFSVQQDEVYIKVRAQPARLRQFADKINYKVMLNPLAISERLREGFKKNDQWVWLPINIQDTKKQCRFTETEFIYGKYSVAKELEDVYVNPDLTKRRVFRGVDRLKLLYGIMETPVEEGGCGFKVKELIHNGALEAFFPLHNYDELRSLQGNWITMFQWPGNQPFKMMRDYLGEKITLYFAWLGVYTNWLAYASIAGLITYVDVALEGDNFNAFLVGPFAVFMAVWSTAFLQKWRRKQTRYALMWGMVDFEQEEQVRVDFEAAMVESPIDGMPTPFFPEGARSSMYLRSHTIIATLTVCVLGIVSGMLVLKYFISGGGEGSVNPHIGSFRVGPVITAILNALQIQFTGEYFTDYAFTLTINENHRTDTEFEDSLISKAFTFSFVNAYMSLFYIGFFSRIMGFKCNDTNNDCMEALNYQLGTIFCARLFIGNFTEIITPLVQNYKTDLENVVADEQRTQLESAIDEAVNNALLTPSTMKAGEGGASEEKGESDVGDIDIDLESPKAKEDFWSTDKVLRLTAIEEQFVLGEYDQQFDLFGDYLEMVIQFGYATLFSCAFTLAPLLGYINNYIEIRVDAWKLTMAKRRPMPRGAEDIGTWQDIMEFMSVVSVVTNFAIICFASNILEHYVGTIHGDAKLACFFVFEHAALAIKYSIMANVEDIPVDVQIQLQRQELICSKILENQADEESDVNEYIVSVEGGVVPSNSEPPVLADVTVYSTDKEWYEKKRKNKPKKAKQ